MSQTKIIVDLEMMLSMLIESIENLQHLTILADLLPAFDTSITKSRRLRYYNELVVYLNKIELLTELAYDHVMRKTDEDELIFNLLQQKYKMYLKKMIFLMHLYDCLIKPSFLHQKLMISSETIFNK